jgi:hypothetical protein
LDRRRAFGYFLVGFFTGCVVTVFAIVFYVNFTFGP